MEYNFKNDSAGVVMKDSEKILIPKAVGVWYTFIMCTT